MKISVTFDIYSGRQNPTWNLSAEDCKELIKRLVALPAADKTINDGGLGYRGFSLTVSPDTLQKSTWDLRVFEKIILINKGNKKNCKDVHGLEKWLLLQATKNGYGDIVKDIKPM